MKKIFAAIALLIVTTGAFAQPAMKEQKAGHVFYISLPDYMSRTLGLNDASTIQYQSKVKQVYGYVVEDGKDDLALVDMKFSSTREFYDNFINDFLVDEQDRKVSTPVETKKGDKTFIESEASYFDKDANMSIYYHIGVVETKTTFYKVISWCATSEKDKFKADFQKILYSLRD